MVNVAISVSTHPTFLHLQDFINQDVGFVSVNILFLCKCEFLFD